MPKAWKTLLEHQYSPLTEPKTVCDSQEKYEESYNQAVLRLELYRQALVLGLQVLGQGRRRFAILHLRAASK